MKLSWRSEWPQWILLLAMFALAAATWAGAPERIPVHWDAHGEVDGYGGRFEGLLVLPLAGLAMYLVMAFLPRLDPGRANYAQFAGAYTALRTLILAFVAGLYGVTHAVLRGARVDMGLVFGLGMGAFLVGLGNLLGKIRPNWFAGIRTPWTLSSKVAWTKTHRLGGWTFTAAGIVILLVAMVRPEWAVWAMVLSLAPAGLVPAIYSYFVWRNDPEKVPPAGTLPAEDDRAT